MKKIAVVFALLFPIFAFADLNDHDAKDIAFNTQSAILQAKANLNQLITKQDRSKYKAVRQSVISALDKWPKDNLSNRAIFPYFNCAQMGRDLMSYGDAWVRDDKSKIWRDHILKRFHESEAGCSESILHPDLSLKELQ